MLVFLLLFLALKLQDPGSHIFVLHEAEVHRIRDDSKNKGVFIQQPHSYARLAQQAGQGKTSDLILRFGETEEEKPDPIIEEERLMNEAKLVEIPVLRFGL